MLVFALILTGLMIAACVTDATRFLIPNWLNASLVVLYPLFVLLVPTDVNWLSGIYAFLVVLAAGYALFALGLMGGGDIKMLCALGLWCGLGMPLVALIVYTGVFGGVLTLCLLAARPMAAWWGAKRNGRMHIPALLTHGADVPYGLAIAAGFLVLLWTGQLPGLKISVAMLF